eukprot:3355593-Pyramimonas_sp.AAC.1
MLVLHCALQPLLQPAPGRGRDAALRPLPGGAALAGRPGLSAVMRLAIPLECACGLRVPRRDVNLLCVCIAPR